MVSAAWRDLCEIYVALIVPDSNWYGTASLPLGVTGAGSREGDRALLITKDPLDVSLAVICLPKAS